MAEIMQEQPQTYVPRMRSTDVDDEIDLRELFRVLWAGKWIILGVAMVISVMALAVTLRMPNIYRSEALLAPVQDNNSGGLAALAGQFGGLASLAGINLGRGAAEKDVIAMEVLKSRRFLYEFIHKHHILVPLMAGTKWDPKTGKLEIDADKYDVAQKRWLGKKVGVDANKPTDWKAYNAFRKILRVDKDKGKGLVTIAVDFVSPELAKQWVAWLIEDVNTDMRLRDTEEAQRSIVYLKDQLNKTPLAAMQQVFYKLIEQQEQTIMLANVRDQYVFKVIDPPVVPEKKVSPKRALIVLLAFVLGVLLSSMVLIVRGMSRSPRAEI